MTTVQSPTLATSNRPILKNKFYAHFDPFRMPEKYEPKVKNPKWVMHHGFLPFVHVVLYKKKRMGRRKPFEWKPRPICYASHIDRYIYQWYANLTSTAYEAYVLKQGMQDVATAYRSNLGKNNVHFAKEVFDFLQTKPSCSVVISDFSDFFDTLNHKLLKKRLKTIFDVAELPEDYYRVFRSVTDYSYFHLEDIAKFLQKEVPDIRNRKTKPARLMSYSEMRNFKGGHLYRNTKKFDDESVGVPQGSPISAVYANVYMIDFDKAMNNYVQAVGGLYRRYSDDLVIVTPELERDNALQFLRSLVDSNHLQLSEKKTKTFRVTGSTVQWQNTSGVWAHKPIEYLGLAFDGVTTKLKEATLNRYYQKLNRHLHLMRKIAEKRHQVVGKRTTYRKFSHLGEANRLHQEHLKGKTMPMNQRNFISYAYGADEILGDRSVHQQVRGHSKLIRKFFSTLEGIEGS